MEDDCEYIKELNKITAELIRAEEQIKSLRYTEEILKQKNIPIKIMFETSSRGSMVFDVDKEFAKELLRLKIDQEIIKHTVLIKTYKQIYGR